MPDVKGDPTTKKYHCTVDVASFWVPYDMLLYAQHGSHVHLHSVLEHCAFSPKTIGHKTASQMHVLTSR